MLQIGDTVRLKKKHPCGSDTFTVTRVGADFKLQCAGCGGTVLLDRVTLEKRLRPARQKEKTLGEKE